MPYSAAFVDSISSSPTVRLNINDGTTWRLLDDGTEFSPPPLRRAVASTLLRDGARIPAAAYDNRTITLRLQLSTSSEDTSATAVQKLLRELDRASNILRIQPTGATSPVFFRTFRSDATSVRDVLERGALRQLDVALLAEPFALGLKQTLSSATVTNDLAAGSNGCFFDISAGNLIGDVETPAILKMTTYSQVEDKGPTAIAVRRRGTPSSAPLPLQCEDMTAGTDTTEPGNDSVMSGSGSNYARCSFSTATAMTVRLTSSLFPASSNVDNRGVYRVFLRYRKNTGGDTIAVQLGWNMGSTSASNRKVTLAASTTHRRWADLGTVQIPFGADPVFDGPSGVELAARGGTFTISAERTAGSGTLDMDCLAFIPVDDHLNLDRMCLVSWPVTTGPTAAVIDGFNECVYFTGASGEIYPVEMPALDGVFPMLSPNQANRVHLLLNAGGAASAITDDKTSTVDVVVSYYPRYLYVRPAAT